MLRAKDTLEAGNKAEFLGSEESILKNNPKDFLHDCSIWVEKNKIWPGPGSL